MPRVTEVKKSRKAQGRCSVCGTAIQAGQPYKHWAFRYGGRHVCCGQCTPKPSQLTANDKLAQVYAAREGLTADLAAFEEGGSPEGLASACECAAEAIRQAAEEWEDSASNIEEGFQHETCQSEEARDNASQAEEEADALEQAGTEVQDRNAQLLEEIKEADAELAEELTKELIEELTDDGADADGALVAWDLAWAGLAEKQADKQAELTETAREEMAGSVNNAEGSQCL